MPYGQQPQRILQDDLNWDSWGTAQLAKSLGLDDAYLGQQDLNSAAFWGASPESIMRTINMGLQNYMQQRQLGALQDITSQQLQAAQNKKGSTGALTGPATTYKNMKMLNGILGTRYNGVGGLGSYGMPKLNGSTMPSLSRFGSPRLSQYSPMDVLDQSPMSGFIG